MPRVIAGRWRGRTLATPQGDRTRPTADRMRQALFDMLLHAPWGGHDRVAGARVLDGFAGTGALGLEALSRGAAHATFLERDGAALAALRRNVATLGAEAAIYAADATAPPPAPPGAGCTLIFLDPPYGAGLVGRAAAALAAAGWIAPDALLLAETGRAEAPPLAEPPDAPNGLPVPTEARLLDARTHGAARVWVYALT